MFATLQKWGNSQGICIPKVLLEQFDLYERQELEIVACEDGILLKKHIAKKHVTLEQRLEAFYGMPLNRIKSVEHIREIDTGSAVGEEF